MWGPPSISCVTGELGDKVPPPPLCGAHTPPPPGSPYVEQHKGATPPVIANGEEKAPPERLAKLAEPRKSIGEWGGREACPITNIPSRHIRAQGDVGRKGLSDGAPVFGRGLWWGLGLGHWSDNPVQGNVGRLGGSEVGSPWWGTGGGVTLGRVKGGCV